MKKTNRNFHTVKIVFDFLKKPKRINITSRKYKKKWIILSAKGILIINDLGMSSPGKELIMKIKIPHIIAGQKFFINIE